MKPVFLDSFDDEQDVLNAFNINETQLNGNILFAYYGIEGYEGDAFVLLERNGVLYEVNGSHCSCYGLEDQWDEEEVDLAELKNRLTNGSFGTSLWYETNKFRKELLAFIEEYENQSKKLSVQLNIEMPKELQDLNDQLLMALKFLDEQDKFNKQIAAELTKDRGATEFFEKRLEELEYRFDKMANFVKRMHQQFQEVAKIEVH